MNSVIDSASTNASTLESWQPKRLQRQRSSAVRSRTDSIVVLSVRNSSAKNTALMIER